MFNLSFPVSTLLFIFLLAGGYFFLTWLRKYLTHNPLSIPQALGVAGAIYAVCLSVSAFSLFKGLVETRDNTRYERVGENKNDLTKGYDILDKRTGKVSRRYI